jgi:transcription elongation factor GreB
MNTDDDDADEDDAPASPNGAKNYITAQGHARLASELHQLRRVERPKIVEIVSWAAGNGDRSENGDYLYGKKRLREIDRRMRFLIKRIEIAEVVDPARHVGQDQIFFGATVTFVNERDEERTVRIVGVDEADLARGDVSLHSPIARALLRAKRGDAVMMQTPTGREEIEILEVRYTDAESRDG